jgi:hypothetical protein
MLFNVELEQLTEYPSLSHLHSSRHADASVVGWIINHNQNTTAGVANSSDTNSTVRLDDMASF